MDRRGYGDSPDTARSDFETDAEDAVEVLSDGACAVGPGGAHLVGHGNGGVAALLAIARRPDLVRSLTLIQPSAFTAAAHHPVVAGLLDRVRDGAPSIADGVTTEQYLRAPGEGWGVAMPEPTSRRPRTVATSTRERPVCPLRGRLLRAPGHYPRPREPTTPATARPGPSTPKGTPACHTPQLPFLQHVFRYRRRDSNGASPRQDADMAHSRQARSADLRKRRPQAAWSTSLRLSRAIPRIARYSGKAAGQRTVSGQQVSKMPASVRR
ncbi:alpha/beta hydrolase [Streptomyces sp. NPDC045470]|uniref:alpha/beta fold hydrolase n=1 Tax=Streptomyces sp. NPDC045470 TaxID=3155469 RepID=UPI0034052F90